MTDIKVTPLGAGQDVGRSCILLSMCGKNIMLDCGMHMGFNDDRRFPDFSFVTRNGPLNEMIDCVIISHFHLDHCGSLPYMSEMVGYNGPIYMTHPTKAITPILLEDYRKITVDRKGECPSNFFTSQMIKDCMKKVIAVNLHETIQVDSELSIKPYYAGHVLGAAMFQVKVGNTSTVYTGDYNMTPDRHLGSAWIDNCKPDLLITESTYATTIRDSKRCRERDFLLKIHDCIEKGGKVLIPVFALGRAQELCILLETYWERMSLNVPIYFAVGLTEKATNYYKLFINWTNEKVKKTFVTRNMFDFKYIKPFDRSWIDNPGAMVVFATPGMLHAGLSLQIFKKWAPNPLNMVIMPGYCVAGTIGHKILGGAKRVETEKGVFIDVRMAVEYMSFSAHADAKGIMTLISQCQPSNVLLVHGEAAKMAFLKAKIENEFNVPCYMPANGQTEVIATNMDIPVDIDLALLKKTLATDQIATADETSNSYSRLLHATLVVSGPGHGMRLVEPETAIQELGLKPHVIRFTSTLRLMDKMKLAVATFTENIFNGLKIKLKDKYPMSLTSSTITIMNSVVIKIDSMSDGAGDGSNNLSVKEVYISWNDDQDNLANYIVKTLKDIPRSV